MKARNKKPQARKIDFTEKVISIDRVAKVVKGGRTLKFRAGVIIGNGKGVVGFGKGKSKETSSAIRKASNDARKNLIKVPMWKGTIPYETIAKFDGARVLLKPAGPGTGILAGGPTRAILEAVGMKDIQAKSLGVSTPISVANACIKALAELESSLQVAKRRNLPLKKVFEG